MSLISVAISTEEIQRRLWRWRYYYSADEEGVAPSADGDGVTSIASTTMVLLMPDDDLAMSHNSQVAEKKTKKGCDNKLVTPAAH